MALWYYMHEAKKVGPISGAQLQQLAASGHIQADTLLLKEGIPKWVPAGRVAGLFRKPTVAAPSGTPLVRHPAEKKSIREASSNPTDRTKPTSRRRSRWPWLVGAGLSAAIAIGVGLALLLPAPNNEGVDKKLSEVKSDKEKTSADEKTPVERTSVEKTPAETMRVETMSVEKPPAVEKKPIEKTPIEKLPVGKPPPEAIIELPVDPWPKLRSRGGELYYLDAALRTVFARGNLKALPEAHRKLPDASARRFDWTTLVSGPQVYNQKNNPLCWAFAGLTSFEWCWVIRNGGEGLALAVQPIPDYCEKYEEGSFHEALNALLVSGTCLEAAYPFVGISGKFRPDVPLPYRAIAWGEVGRDTRSPSVSRIKQALLDHGPLTSGVFATPQMEKYKGGVFDEHFVVPPKTSNTNHQVVIVGWDDDKEKGCWKIQNSWGTKWGEGGFMWIEYGCNNVGDGACWIRPQSIHYALPEKAASEVAPHAAAFPNWPGAQSIALPDLPKRARITVAEVPKRLGERVVVEFEAKSFGITLPAKDVQLVSGATGDGLRVTILNSALKDFPSTEPAGLYRHYGGKKLLVSGIVDQVTVTRSVTNWIIEVTRPDQIEILD